MPHILDQIALFAPWVGGAVALAWAAYEFGMWRGRKMTGAEFWRERYAAVARDRRGRFAKKDHAP